ncbi:hypothetical protein J0X14_13790 [Muricauda sp. CAU 1633]|uniref:hypothetical protein n=1 Tax=Allomuricauda sp. CAU 1633 TaxID=2816036 RepID=UPI001A8CDAF7|nr:hypothetical protein [Muricauda sp. CAU 1633]MBO0323376.1 hypothetical protein [Muricauda sp. CAU 1633]
MKSTQTLVFLTLLTTILCIGDLAAQYGYGSPYGNRYGRRQSTIPQAQETPKEVEPPTAEEVVDQQMPSITEALGLNPFEEAVVRTTLLQSVQQRIELQILGLEPLKMKEEYEKILKKQNEELQAGLPEDKYNAFIELQENSFKAKKKKKKKKKKD